MFLAATSINIMKKIKQKKYFVRKKAAQGQKEPHLDKQLPLANSS